MKVTIKQILKELTSLDLCQKGARLPDDELQLLADRWFEIMNAQFVSSDVFHDAIVMFQAVNSWFPTVHEILDNIKSVWEDRKRNTKALPEPDFVPPTPEEMKENRKKLRRIFQNIGTKI